MKNTNSYLLTVGALAVLIFGCVTYDLSPKDEAWNPYEVGDKFTFVSNKNDERIFTVSKVEKTTDKVNVYAGNLSKLKESLTVFATEENHSSDEFPLLTIFKNSQDQSFLNFNFALPEMLEINHVEEIPDANSKLESANGFAGNDFLNISPVLNVSPDVKIPYATNFIFGKSTGFVQFSLINSEVWSLKRN